MTSTAWIAAVIAGLTAGLAPLFLAPLLRRWGVVDVPNERSSHAVPTLRGGGLATLLGLLVGLITAIVLIDSSSDRQFLTLVGAAGFLMGALGFTEDVRGVPIRWRASAQLAVGVAMSFVAVELGGVSPWWIPLLAFMFIAYVNAANFMDGINGISGLQGFVVGVAFTAVGMVSETSWLVVTGSIIAVVCVVFLPWNLRSAGMFLGDVGSYLIGGTVISVASLAGVDGVPILAAVAPVIIYFADTGATLVRRALKGDPVFSAHRTHTYQRLTDTGLSHIQVSLLVAALTAVASGVGIFATTIMPTSIGVVLIGLIVGFYLSLPRLRGQEVRGMPRMELDWVDPPPAEVVRPDWSPRRWAVIGSSGFIGSGLVRHLTVNEHEVVQLAAPRLTLDPHITDGADVAAIASEHPAVSKLVPALHGVDVVLNAAGLATPDRDHDEQLYGANSLLPAVVAEASSLAGVGRVIHLSSAAVQGRRPILDCSAEVEPFSPYSRSKALGERGLFALSKLHANRVPKVTVVVVRATSVQGHGRGTTETLRRVANSPLASVAAPGDQPSIVSSLEGLVSFVHDIGRSPTALPPITLQPWEGLNAREVLELAGGRTPWTLPRGLCRAVIFLGRALGRVVPSVNGIVRRLEVMWFGQGQEDLTLPDIAGVNEDRIRATLRGGEGTV